METIKVPIMLLTVTQAAQRLNISRSLLYDLVLSGQIVSIKIQKARRIPISALEAFINKQLQGGKNDE
ncbi:MAG: helix-turn-helix domain-containing protein [Ktedonobacteraceae bacterium]|nr:helix-turn-helix domain-containing protein [Ktedonobacteraceae bacterium]MBA3824128.1 helix-turn-helix domain-containing protein [Ktedonobacterales bacterium]